MNFEKVIIDALSMGDKVAFVGKEGISTFQNIIRKYSLKNSTIDLHDKESVLNFLADDNYGTVAILLDDAAALPSYFDVWAYSHTDVPKIRALCTRVCPRSTLKWNKAVE